MNIIDIQDQLKNFSEQQLIAEMQAPTGSAPQFLVLGEIKRRKRVRDDFAKREAAQQPTVAQEAVASAGVPQSGITGMAEAMAPKSTMVQKAMRSGGLMQFGAEIQRSLAEKTKNEQIDPFLDEVEQMAQTEFGVDSGSFGSGQSIMPVPNFPNRGFPTPPVRGGPFGGGRMGGKGGGMSGIHLARQLQPIAIPEAMNPSPSPVQKYDRGGLLPLGLRQNNPGNIRPGAGFIGETGQGGGYAQFGSEEEGLRALARLLGTYSDEYGINTLRGLTSRYAPRSDNEASFDNYVSYLGEQLGMDPDEEFDLKSRRDELIPAIVGFEQGRDFGDRYSQGQISRAIEAAGTDDPEEVARILGGSDEPGIISKIASAINPISTAQAQGAGSPLVSPTMIFDDDAAVSPNILPSMPSEDGSDMGAIVQDGAIVMPPSEVFTDPSYFGDLATPRDDRSAQMPTFSGPTVDESGGTQTVVEDGAIVMKPGPVEPDMVVDPNVLSPVMPDFAMSAVASSDDEDTVEDPDAPPTTPEPEAQPERKGTDDGSTPQTGLAKEIADLQAKLEKDRETDKYLALAQAGLALMSSKEPTLLGAVGEAGISGLTAFREAQERYQEGVVDLINAKAKLQKKSGQEFTKNQMLQRAEAFRKLANDPLATEQDKIRNVLFADLLEQQAFGMGGGGLGMFDVASSE